MTALKKDFERWNPREKSTWVFQVFKKYSFELDRNIGSYIPASKYTYRQLGKSGAKWEDDVTSHFAFVGKEKKLFDNLKHWSDSFNKFDNWVNLNMIMAMCSNFETYLAAVISLSITSDPGIVLGASKLIDGMSIIKHGVPNKLDLSKYIDSCIKGDWNSRASAFNNIFGMVPDVITRNISHLEAIRKLRNQVGHSFGRDIDDARDYVIKKILPTETISRERTMRFHRLIWGIAKNIDMYLLKAHIGEFQSLNFYHSLYNTLPLNAHPSIRARLFKKKIGQSGVASVGKDFSKGLVTYL